MPYKFADTIASLRTMRDSPLPAGEEVLPTLNADQAWQWVLDLMGDAANDPNHPIAQVFNRLLADPPRDSTEVECLVLYQATARMLEVGWHMTRIMGRAMLHQRAAQEGSGPQASTAQAQAVCRQVVELGRDLPNTLEDIIPAAQAALAGRR